MTSALHNSLPRIAVVEDDRDLLDTTLEYLHAQGYPAWGVCSAEDFYKRFAVDTVDVVVLDIGLPGENGISAANHLRELPDLMVIIVSARDNTHDRLAGLKAGADRYLVKPVDLAVLAANIDAAGRRLLHPDTNPAATQARGSKPPADLWRLTKNNSCLTAPNGRVLALTAREYILLNCLFEAKGGIVTKCSIADKIIGHRVLNSCERMDVLLARLRKKSKLALGLSLPIKTMNQVGYIFTANATVEE